MFASRSPRRRLPVLLGTAALGVALGGGLVGCGDDTSDSDGQAVEPTTSASSSVSSSPSSSAPADAPACADTWSEGGTLPAAYKGCVDDAGAYQKADSLGCSSGQRIVRFDDRYYGVPGGEIHMTTVALLQDHDYRAAVRRCRA